MQTLLNTPIWKPLTGLLAAVTCVLAATCRADNPIVQTCFTADPAPVVHDGTGCTGGTQKTKSTLVYETKILTIET